MTPAKFWTEAAQWGSYLRNGDPGACMYGFDERGLVQSERHRTTCIDYLTEHCKPAARNLDNPKAELATIDSLIAYLRTAKVDAGQPAAVPRQRGNEFLPRHVPPADLDSFEVGYFKCAEWLASGHGPKYENDNNLDDADRAKLKGFTRAATKSGKADCAAFCKANAADLVTYCAESGRDLESAGHDFWLSRNGHGAGYFDRGNDPVFDRLQEAARAWSEVECSAYRNRLEFN